MTKLYSLHVNDEPVLEVQAEPTGLPLKPKINPAWLRLWVARALRQRIYERDDRKKACSAPR